MPLKRFECIGNEDDLAAIGIEARTLRLPSAAMIGACLVGGPGEAARMWMPKTTNPYCDVTTYVLRISPSRRCLCAMRREARNRRERVRSPTARLQPVPACA